MPTINVKRDQLMAKLGQSYSDSEFEELCFQFGIELDEITSEKQMALKEKGTAQEISGQQLQAQEQQQSHSDEVIYKIDIPANRYDLLSLEGLVLALRVFTEKMPPPTFELVKGELEFTVDAHAIAVRPVLVGAVVRGLDLYRDELYERLIDLQDKIHQNIGRKRSIVSIGTHDLDTILGPFRYTAVPPQQLKFTPLNQEREFFANELMDFYAESYLKPYLPLIKDKPEYPAIYDSNNTVLSMPPIINGNHSKISRDTKNILIEITATDKDKAMIALDTLLVMLASCNDSYRVETVQVRNLSNNTTCMTPDPESFYTSERIETDYVNKSLGINIDASEMAKLLTRMSLSATSDASGLHIDVRVPPNRHDIIHKCDVMEDVGIAYGYDNIIKTLPKSVTISSQVPMNKFSDQLRHEVARCGYTEALNFALCSEDDVASSLKRPPHNFVKIANPKTVEFQVARTCLLSGLMKTLNSNKNMPLPMKLFEVGDVVFADPQNDVGARNERHLAAIYQGKQTSGFEVIHGLLDRIMQVIECPYIGDFPDRAELKSGYYIESRHDSAYMAECCAVIIYNGTPIGFMGILHPEVLTNFELNHPASALEINMENFPCASNVS